MPIRFQLDEVEMVRTIISLKRQILAAKDNGFMDDKEVTKYTDLLNKFQKNLDSHMKLEEVPLP
tara:strand:- start:329 stop:520 length:192 start_codon:yes stop_codon:yes gene_type:complete